MKVQFNEARYGRSNGFPCGTIVCSNTWAWSTTPPTSGSPTSWPRAGPGRGHGRAADFDVWDRYDYDRDGNFNEPDGYLDHFQIVHAGGDQADGDPIYGEDASGATAGTPSSPRRPDRPAGNPSAAPRSVTPASGSATTPSSRRTAAAASSTTSTPTTSACRTTTTSSGGDNNNEHWTLMAQSRLGAENDGGIGERGGDLGAWNKLQLGWLNYAVMTADQKGRSTSVRRSTTPEGRRPLVVSLPRRRSPPTRRAGLRRACSGYGGTPTTSTTMTRQVTLPAGDRRSLTFKTRYDIEDCGCGHV